MRKKLLPKKFAPKNKRRNPTRKEFCLQKIFAISFFSIFPKSNCNVSTAAAFRLSPQKLPFFFVLSPSSFVLSSLSFSLSISRFLSFPLSSLSSLFLSFSFFFSFPSLSFLLSHSLTHFIFLFLSFFFSLSFSHVWKERKVVRANAKPGASMMTDDLASNGEERRTPSCRKMEK